MIIIYLCALLGNQLVLIIDNQLVLIVEKTYFLCFRFGFTMFNLTFNNISVIS